MPDTKPSPFTPEQETRIRDMIAADRIEQGRLQAERIRRSLENMALHTERTLADPRRC